MPSKCRDCPSEALARNGKRFRNLCVVCWNRYQRERYQVNHARSLEVRRALYQKHAAKRRAESAERKKENRVRYSLLEWLRKRGISAEMIPTDDLNALVEMKKAVIAAKKTVANL